MRKPAGPNANVQSLRRELNELLAEVEKPGLTPRQRQALEKSIREIVIDLEQFLHELDPVGLPTSVFDPGNPQVVGYFIALALTAQTKHPLAEVSRFYGAGIYAIYYNGDFPLYGPLSGSETPIYVGQASPGSNARTPKEQGERLWKRVNEHRRNIELASSTLDIADFECRALVVQSGWETAAEDYLIRLFRPLWNNETKLVFGLGKHGDDASTRANKRSPWDTLHPGRTWAAAESLVDAKSPELIQEQVTSHFEKHPPFQDLNSVLATFLAELKQL